MNFRTAIIWVCVIFSWSCGHTPIHGAVPEGEPSSVVINLWVEDVPEMPAHLILEGCEMWSELGIGCRLVNDKFLADVRYLAIRKPCRPAPLPPKGNGKKTLATAHSDGHVKMHVNCFVDDKGRLDEEKMRAVSGHELGHELGIWDHVPLACNDSDAKYLLLADGEKLCGEAMMNPDYDEDVLELTDMDGHAFARRNRDYSVYRETIDKNGTRPRPDVICNYGDRQETPD